MKRNLTIGTRRSQLALWQANYVADALRRHDPELSVQLQHIVTQGDKILDVPLARIGCKGLFTKLIIQAGIKRVVYAEKYRLNDGIELMERAGIKVVYLNPDDASQEEAEPRT